MWLNFLRHSDQRGKSVPLHLHSRRDHWYIRCTGFHPGSSEVGPHCAAFGHDGRAEPSARTRDEGSMARSRGSVVGAVRSIAVHRGGVPVRGRPAASTSFVERVFEARQSRCLALPAKAKAARFADDLLELLFPHFSEEVYYSAAEIDGRLKLLLRNLKGVLQPLAALMPHGVAETADHFAATLPGVYDSLLLDAAAIHAGDPAAESLDEVISAYPGFLAIA